MWNDNISPERERQYEFCTMFPNCDQQGSLYEEVKRKRGINDVSEAREKNNFVYRVKLLFRYRLVNLKTLCAFRVFIRRQF